MLFRSADIGLTGATPNNLIYREGRPDRKVTKDNIVDELERMIRARVAEKAALSAKETALSAKETALSAIETALSANESSDPVAEGSP